MKTPDERSNELLAVIKDMVPTHAHRCCKCGVVEPCELGQFCDGPASNDYCLMCADEQIANALPCGKCGATEGYAVRRSVEIGGESDERRDQIGMECNVCGAVFEIEDISPNFLN